MSFSGEVVIAPIGIPTLCDIDPDVWLLTAEAMGDLIVPKGDANDGDSNK